MSSPDHKAEWLKRMADCAERQSRFDNWRVEIAIVGFAALVVSVFCVALGR